MRYPFRFPLLLFLSMIGVNGGANPLYLGFLEFTKGSANVRVAFKKDTKWQRAVPDPKDQKELSASAKFLPDSMKWFVAFDGRSLGSVSSRNATPTHYNAVATQKVENKKLPAKVGVASEEFGTWSEEKRYRPLVVISEANVTDPDQWKPGIPTSLAESAGKKAFRSTYPHIVTCNANGEGNHPVTYDDSNLRIKKSYHSGDGDWVISVQLDPKKNHCEMTAGDDSFAVNWFRIARNESKLLGSDMTLLDAGDYDGSGHSMLIFQKRSYNYDGYVMWLPDFSEKVESGWNSH